MLRESLDDAQVRMHVHFMALAQAPRKTGDANVL